MRFHIFANPVGDATLVRGALVPAFMRLAGKANWWAPRPLRRLYDRFGLREAPEPEVPRPTGSRNGEVTAPIRPKSPVPASVAGEGSIIE